MTICLKSGDRVYLASQLRGPRCEQKAAYVARVFTASAVPNPFDLSATPLRGPVLCAELRFPLPGFRIFADLGSGDIQSLVDPSTGETLYVYVSVQAPENGSAAPIPTGPGGGFSGSSAAVKSLCRTVSNMRGAIATTQVSEGSMDEASPMMVGDGYLG